MPRWMPVVFVVGLIAPPASAAVSVPTATCFGRAATYVGTDGDDTFELTGRTDVLVMGGGNDVVHRHSDELSDPDFICLGPGDDRFYASAGDATVDGGSGNDDISGGLEGADTLYGGPGDDILRGWDGPDAIVGGEGDDTIYGGGGGDRLSGGEGADTLWGDNGDTCDGGPGHDTLRHCRPPAHQSKGRGVERNQESLTNAP